jgi:Tfp pilus assembly protein PilX
MFQRVHRDESGFAMVFAVLVVFVVVTLSITVLSLSIHNSEQSAYDRKRVTSVVAAEAGVDDAWNRIQTTAPEILPSAGCTEASRLAHPLTGSVEAEPGPATVSAVYTWYADSAGTTLLTGCPSQTNVPAGVLVTATGRTSNTVPRQVQAYMTLTPNYGGFDAAILSVTNTTFANNFTVTGLTGNDGDIYITSGDLVVTNSPTVYGNVYVPVGSASLSNGTQIVGNLWALDEVTINNPATVTGNVISSTSSIGGSGTVGGSATAGTTIAAGLTVGGNEYPNTPQGPPPTQAFPKLCQVAITGVCSAMPWAGYTVSTYTDCATAYTALTAGPIIGDRVIWINAVCELNIANNDEIEFTGNLAIVTQGSIKMNNRTDWYGSSGKSLYLIVNYRTIFPASCSSLYGITTSNNSNFHDASVLFYSPCTVTLNNSNNFTGQALGNTVNITNNFTMSYKPVLVPGVPTLMGFDQGIVYLREVA